MSLLFRRKPLRIALTPSRVIVSEGRPVELEPGADAPEWRAAVEALPEVLRGPLGNQRGEASLVLADQFVRYALLPWSEALKTDAQWLALAGHRFAALHGPRTAQWEVRLTETAPLGPRLACAIDRELVEALASTFVAANLRLVSVQPFLVAAFNHIRRKVGDGSCWIIVEEAGRLTLALIHRGVWTAIRARRIEPSWRKVLPEIIERETAFLGLDERCTRVIVFAQGAFEDEYEAFRMQTLSYPEIAIAWE